MLGRSLQVFFLNWALLRLNPALPRLSLRPRDFPPPLFPHTFRRLCPERKSHRAKVPGSDLARERISQGPIGRFAPRSELAWERKVVEVICRKSSAERAANYPYRFPHSAAFPWIAKLPFPRIVQQICNRYVDITRAQQLLSWATIWPSVGMTYRIASMPLASCGPFLPYYLWSDCQRTE